MYSPKHFMTISILNRTIVEHYINISNHSLNIMRWSNTTGREKNLSWSSSCFFGFDPDLIWPPDNTQRIIPYLSITESIEQTLYNNSPFTDPFDFRIVTIIGRPFLTAIQRRLFVFCNHTKRFNHRLFQTNCYNKIQTLQFFKLSR